MPEIELDQLATATVDAATWSSQDIGSVGATGGSVQTTNPDGTVTFTVKGSGRHLGYRRCLSVRLSDPDRQTALSRRGVVCQTPTDNWAKAGVMIRETLDPSSPHALMAVTPGSGIVFLRRSTKGGQSVSTHGALTAAPYWVRIIRNGNTFSAYASGDGTAWTPVGTLIFSGGGDSWNTVDGGFTTSP